jgi:hypothetical protein
MLTLYSDPIFELLSDHKLNVLVIVITLEKVRKTSLFQLDQVQGLQYQYYSSLVLTVINSGRRGKMLYY